MFEERSTRGPLRAIIAATVSLLALRAEAQSVATPPGEVDAVRAAAREYLAALERGDATRLRALWTADGDYIDAAGQTFKAQDLIAQIAPVAPATEKGAGGAAPPPSRLRFVSPEIAIEDGTTAFHAGDGGDASTGRFTAIWVKRGGKWLLDGLREAVTAAPPGNPKLRSLEWLLGEWRGVSEDAVTLMSWHWNDGGNYLVGEFVTYRDGQAIAGGSQRIGWDPDAGQIKSWVFDSQGGSGEGRWHADGARWRVDSTHVTGDGKHAKGTTTYVPGDDDTFVLEVAGEWQPDGAKQVDAKPAEPTLPAGRTVFRRAAE